MTLPAADRAYMATLRPSRDRDRLAERTATAAEAMTGSGLDRLAEEVSKIEDLRCLELSMLLNRTGRAALSPVDRAALAAEAHMRLDRPKVAASIRDVFLRGRVADDPVPAGESEETPKLTGTDVKVTRLRGGLRLLNGAAEPLLIDHYGREFGKSIEEPYREALIRDRLAEENDSPDSPLIDLLDVAADTDAEETVRIDGVELVLHRRRPSLIYGVGGVGKSRLARRFVAALETTRKTLLVLSEDEANYRQQIEAAIPNLRRGQILVGDSPAEDVSLVVVDVLSAWLRRHGLDENSNPDVRAGWHLMRERWPTAVIVAVHHSRKLVPGSPPSPRGASDIGNSAGVIYRLGPSLVVNEKRTNGPPLPKLRTETTAVGISLTPMPDLERAAQAQDDAVAMLAGRAPDGGRITIEQWLQATYPGGDWPAVSQQTGKPLALRTLSSRLVALRKPPQLTDPD